METLPAKRIDKLIYVVRGQNIMLDSDLAGLYGVTTGNLNKAVSRNLDRFPEDFMFSLSLQEFRDLKFQFGTSSWGGRRKPPRAFTEQGVAMLSSILNSKQAAQVNIQIMRTFVKLRQLASSHDEIRRKLTTMERKLGQHDQEIAGIIQAIRELMKPPSKSAARRIGF